MNSKLNFLLAACLVLQACTSPEKLMSDRSADRICFGKAGGFTNIPMEYVLFEKGQLCRIRNDSLIMIHRIGRKQLRTLDSLLATDEFNGLNLNEPGNITYYIRTLRNGTEKELKWSDTSGNELIREIYKTLLQSLKSQP